SVSFMTSARRLAWWSSVPGVVEHDPVRARPLQLIRAKLHTAATLAVRLALDELLAFVEAVQNLVEIEAAPLRALEQRLAQDRVDELVFVLIALGMHARAEAAALAVEVDVVLGDPGPDRLVAGGDPIHARVGCGVAHLVEFLSKEDSSLGRVPLGLAE